jgi:hypothetical protein
MRTGPQIARPPNFFLFGGRLFVEEVVESQIKTTK